MVLEKLSESLKNTLSKIARSMFVDEKLIDELVKGIQRGLLQADVNVQLVFSLTKEIKRRSMEEKPPAGITQKEYLVQIVYEELAKFLGGEKNEVVINKKPFKIMFNGLYGSGKTTTISKVAKFYQKRGYKIATIGLDVHRPAAPEQLQQVSDRVGILCFIKKGEKDPLKIYKEFEKELNKFDIILIDTAGRDALSKDLIEELELLNNYIKPDERLLVISADIGQAAQKQAQQFHDSCNITGVVITKMDGTAKGGGALSACSITKAPVKFIGVGEKVDDLEQFSPKGFVGRLLGMGDIEALLEKAQFAIDDEKAEKIGKKIIEGDFTFIDLYDQMEAMQKMGSLQKIIDLIPGMGNLNIPKEMLNVQESKLKKWKFILQSMTKKELENPEIIDSARIDRIAKGSGSSSGDVRDLLKQYKMSKKMMKVMKGSDGDDVSKLMKKIKMPKGMKF